MSALKQTHPTNGLLALYICTKSNHMILRISYLLVLFVLVSSDLVSQSLWELIPETSIEKSGNEEREIVPDHYLTLSLDYKALKKTLHKAPKSYQKGNYNALASLDLPLPDGTMARFGFYESSCFSPVLQEKFPEIRSYRGVALDGSGIQARVDFGHMGFHAVIKTSKGDVYIDPYYLYGTDNYITYYTKDDPIGKDLGHLTCGSEAHNHFNGEEDLTEQREVMDAVRKNNGTPVTKYTYRLALACTGLWGDIWGDVSVIMSRFNTGVNRLNMIYENELGATFKLIDNNEDLIFFGDTEPYIFMREGRRLVGQNTRVLDNAVGNDAYDIGHVFTTGCTDGVAGIASLGSLCNATSKGNGVSCIGSRNVSSFMVTVTAHEIGHQFSALHTWSNCPGNEQNISFDAAYEPGSGSTIMSYAGLCGGNNIAATNDDYFHVFSLEQMSAHMESARCGDKEVESGNHAPDLFIPIGDGVVIPISTPFELDGDATDKDGDMLTYSWEQMDRGPSTQLGDPMSSAPSFRSLYPSTESKRVFPSLPAILNNLNPATEVLPTYSRDLTFRFIVRDNHPGVGSTVWEQIRFSSTESAGPFVVTEPSSVTFAEVGSNYTVEWDVANTDNAEVDCQFVDIYLSLDNGQNFDVILKENTPNDGSETIIIPNEITTVGRIKVKARNNIFFNIGRGDLIIRAPSNPGFYVDVSDKTLDVCVPDRIQIDISGTSFQDFDNPVNLEIIDGLPPNANLSFSENPIAPDGNTTLTIDMDPAQVSDTYEIVLQATSPGADTVFQRVTVNVTGSDMSALQLASPVSGAVDLGGTPTFQWEPTPNAETYILEVSTSPTFGNTNVLTATDIPFNVYIPTIVLDNSELYYWRVRAINQCVDFPSEIFTFGTVTLACNSYAATDLPKNISQGLPTVESQILVPEAGTIADVNVELLGIGHGRVRDLRVTLVSPSEKEVELFAGVCSGANVSMGFDSDSPLLFGCPLNTGRVINPQEESLFDFVGDETQGLWTLRLQDERAGDGGRFDDFELELCGSVSLKNPYIVNNFVLEVPTGRADRLKSSELLSEDDDNSANELMYTIVVETSRGTLYINGSPAGVGSTFTQADINNNRLRYVHEGTEDESDHFIFTVIDGEGGWIDMTRFDINMEEGFLSSTNEIEENQETFKIFPNPTKDLIHISQQEKDGSTWNVGLTDINGRVVYTTQFSSNTTIDATPLKSGMYILILNNGEQQVTQRVSVIK